MWRVASNFARPGPLLIRVLWQYQVWARAVRKAPPSTGPRLQAVLVGMLGILQYLMWLAFGGGDGDDSGVLSTLR